MGVSDQVEQSSRVSEPFQPSAGRLEGISDYEKAVEEEEPWRALQDGQRSGPKEGQTRSESASAELGNSAPPRHGSEYLTQIGFQASTEGSVMARWLSPSASMIHIWRLPARLEENTIWLPSGDQLG